MRRATCPICQWRRSLKFLSTLSLRRATIRFFDTRGLLVISIHALLAESDRSMFSSIVYSSVFLSTLSLRRATHPYRHLAVRNQISIHALLAESDPLHWAPLRSWYISIHALLAESDSFTASITSAVAVFLSTLSLRRATSSTWWTALWQRNFYPRSPCGERPVAGSCRNGVIGFLSTLSLRRATRGHRLRWNPWSISIHALLAESDRRWSRGCRCPANFYPRSPCGERP